MLRIGLLLDGNNVSAWVNELISAVREMPDAKIIVAVVNESPRTMNKTSGAIVYKLLRNIDKRLMRISKDPFKKQRLDLQGIKIIPVVPIKTKYSD